jgi:hypothetical protein
MGLLRTAPKALVVNNSIAAAKIVAKDFSVGIPDGLSKLERVFGFYGLICELGNCVSTNAISRRANDDVPP